MTNQLRTDAQALLDSPITQYQIAKDTSVSQPNISKLKSGERTLSNASLATVEALAEYWDNTMGLYMVSTLKTLPDGSMEVTDMNVDYGTLHIQDGWNMIDSTNSDFGRKLVDGDRVDIAGGPEDMSSWITVSLTGYDEGAYTFDEASTKPFRDAWNEELKKWPFLCEEKIG